MSLIKFDPPGYLEDLNQQGKDIWHDYISRTFDETRQGDPGEKTHCDFYGPREHFINPAKYELDNDATEIDITWTAFPRNISVDYPDDYQRWEIADSSRNRQDEYCEWSITRNVDKKIKRIIFTCETPEYWVLLSKLDQQKLLELYQEHIDPSVEAKDLFKNGEYNPLNKWNDSTVNGAMHLIQENNTLGAEIELAGGASIRRVIDGRELTGERELIKCGKYGGIERHSDPHIGAQANSVARQKAYVTLANPVGIYFASLNTLGWQTPDGTDPMEFWKYTRGTPDKPVRAIFEVPESYGYSVGDILINGKNINFGGQIADYINMKLTAIGCSFGKVDVEPMNGCVSCHAIPKLMEMTSLKSFDMQMRSMSIIKKYR